MRHEEQTFRFSGKLARLFGRESVSSETAALFELVKNCYDADSPKATITFRDFKLENGKNAKIILEDQGFGMTYADIVDKWMVIGTYSKERETRTPKGRRVTGNKGIGRFATEKLAREVTIVSWPESTNEEITLKINWNDFEGEEHEEKEILFNDVKIPIDINPNRSNPKSHGVKIILENLREKWDDKKINKLRHSISSIIFPAELQKMKEDFFEVEIHAEEFSREVPTKVESVMFKKAPYKVKCFLPDMKSETTAQIYRKGTLVSSPTVDCTKVFDDGEHWKPFGPCSVVFYLFPDRSKTEPWDRYYRDVLTISERKAIVRENHGVKIYRDSFWISPYGGKGNDWLDLEADRVQSNLRPGNSQVIGFVTISKDENKEVLDTTTRERIVENIYFRSLRHFVKQVFNEFFEYRQGYVKTQKEASPIIRHEAFVQSEIKYLQDFIEDHWQLDKKSKKPIVSSLKQINKTFNEYRKELDDEIKQLEQEERTYRNLAALGISSAASYHEVFNIVTSIEEAPLTIINKLKENKIDDKELMNFLQQLDDKISIISHFTWFIRKFVQNVGRVVEAELREKIMIKKEISSISHDYSSSLIDSLNIDVRCFPSDLKIVMNKADLYSIILNLLTNSIKALDETENKKIRITISKSARDLKIKFSDNGKGIKDSIRSKIFRVLYSSYENGTGMGLPITLETLRKYSGKIELLPDSEFTKGATFLISVPLEELK